MADKINSNAPSTQSLIEIPRQYSVFKRVQSIKQPKGEYVSAKEFSCQSLGEGIEGLHAKECYNSSFMGNAVEFLVNILTGADPFDRIHDLKFAGRKNNIKGARLLLQTITSLDDQSIINTCRLVTLANFSHEVDNLGELTSKGIDKETIENIRIMVQRTLHFLDLYGPKFDEHISVGDSLYISDGYIDFLTKDTLWDLKTSAKGLKNKAYILQVIVYWRLGLRNQNSEFKNIKYLGFFFPRTNEVYRLDVSKIPQETIDKVENEVIGPAPLTRSERLELIRKNQATMDKL